MKGIKPLFSSHSEEWSTPDDLFEWLDFIFQFTLDPCATPSNAKCEKFFTQQDDGLAQSWAGHRVFCNPPYGRRIGAWVAKAALEAATGDALVAMLLPSRTDTKWFQKYCVGRVVIFLEGRLKFGGSENSAPFPSIVVLFLPMRKR